MSEPVIIGDATLHLGDCVEVIATLPANSVAAIVCDPPYLLNFMGKAFDQQHKALPGANEGQKMQAWHARWVAEAFRILKPGGHLAAFGGDRTHHRLLAAMEDAGFELRQNVYWAFGCVDEETEVLTPSGWVRYHKAISDISLLCYNQESDSFEWDTPENARQVYAYEYEDTAYRITGDFTDQLVSRNHRCLIEREGTLVFAFAEHAAQESEIRVPVLETVSDLQKAIADAYRPQEIRASRLAATHLARITPVHYKGLMWCPTVATGAFVARRNGKVFITGNSGFPKSQDAGKALDRKAGAEREVVGIKDHKGRAAASVYAGQFNTNSEGDQITAPATEAAKKWAGFKTALKPAVEPICVGRKPMIGTLADNLLAWGCGALNIAGCRVDFDKETEPRKKWEEPSGKKIYDGSTWENRIPIRPVGKNKTIGESYLQGRYPAHLLHDGSPEVVGLFPVTSSGLLMSHHTRTRDKKQNAYGDSGSAARLFQSCPYDAGDFDPLFYSGKAAKRDRTEGTKCAGQRYVLRSDLTDQEKDYVMAELKRLGLCF